MSKNLSSPGQRGNALVNTLTGNSAANTLNGGAGADTMTGGLGNDTYIVNLATDIATELSGQGIDTIKSSIGYHLKDTDGAGGNGGNVEKLILTGTGNINGIGNGLANTLTGNSAANVLNGSAGKDTLTGGAVQDLFLFNTALNAAGNLDTITDFSAVDDTIRLENAIFAKLTATVTLSAANFHDSPTSTAAASDDFILYDIDSGAL